MHFGTRKWQQHQDDIKTGELGVVHQLIPHIGLKWIPPELIILIIFKDPSFNQVWTFLMVHGV